MDSSGAFHKKRNMPPQKTIKIMLYRSVFFVLAVIVIMLRSKIQGIGFRGVWLFYPISSRLKFTSRMRRAATSDSSTILHMILFDPVKRSNRL